MIFRFLMLYTCMCSLFSETYDVSITLENKVIGNIDDRLFGQFLEHVHKAEGGPEAAIDPKTKKMRPAVMQKIKDMQIPIIRFPGGGLVEAPHYRWTHMIDGAYDRDEHARPVTVKKDGNTRSYYFGLDEFLKMCEEHNSEPILVVKCADVARGYVPANEIIEQASSMIAYCNAPVDADLPDNILRWAKLRAANGRVKPYAVKLWQIGNEFTWVAAHRMEKTGMSKEQVSDAYVDAVVKIYNALVKVDKNIELIVENNMEEPGMDFKVTDKIAEALGDKIHYITTHKYFSWGIKVLQKNGKDIGFNDFTPKDYWYAATSAPGTDERGMAYFQKVELDKAKEHGYKMAITEWNWNSWWSLKNLPEDSPKPFDEPMWAKGVAAGSMLHGFMRASHHISIATQSMLVGTGWDIRAIDVKNGNCAYHPSGQITTLYGKHHGDKRYAWRAESDIPTYNQVFTLGQLPANPKVAYLDLIVSANADHVYLHIINRDFDKDCKLRVNSDALLPISQGQAEIFSLSGEFDGGRKLQEAGKEIATVTHAHQQRQGGNWNFIVPAKTVQVIKIKRN